MADQSNGISYCDETWNCAIGCSPTSVGCQRCWARGMVRRIEASGHGGAEPTVTCTGAWNDHVELMPRWLARPLRWRRPRVVLVQTLGDLFHDGVPFEYIAAVYGVMAACPQHTFLVLTKRPERMLEFCRWVEKRGEDGKLLFPYDGLSWRIGQFLAVSAARQGVQFSKTDPRRAPWPAPNAWLGVSAENQETLDKRWAVLRQVPAAKRWLSLEPLLGPIDLKPGDYIPPLGGGPRVWLNLPPWESPPPAVDWIAVGPETGPRPRPCDVEWIRSVARQCQAAGVPVHVKAVPVYQSVGHAPPRPSKRPEEWPDDLRIQSEVPRG